MTIKEINDRWRSIQEMRTDIIDRQVEGELQIILDELNGQYCSEIRRFRQDLLEAGFIPKLAKEISELTDD
jgi:hypothetical protein